MNTQQKLNLIKRQTAEILTEEELETLLKEKSTPVVYLGYAPTGRPHIGYLIPAMKIKDFVNAGLKVKILLADIHAFLDNMKSPVELAGQRADFYKEELAVLYQAIGADISKIEFIKGSDFQLEKKYVFDLYRLSALSTVERAKHAASEVVKMDENPKLSGLIYPLMQNLDEQYLEADIQYAGMDQRKIMGFARESLPKLNYKKRVEIMTPMLPGISGGKMSASDATSKIDLLDSKEAIEEKINKAFCPEGEIKDNGLLMFLKYVLMVLKEDKGEKFLVERNKKFGGNVEYKNYADLENAFLAKTLHPADLKKALARDLVDILGPVRDAFKNKQDLINEAYPS